MRTIPLPLGHLWSLLCWWESSCCLSGAQPGRSRRAVYSLLSVFPLLHWIPVWTWLESCSLLLRMSISGTQREVSSWLLSFCFALLAGHAFRCIYFSVWEGGRHMLVLSLTARWSSVSRAQDAFPPVPTICTSLCSHQLCFLAHRIWGQSDT